MEDLPKSQGGTLPVTRRCHNGQHASCSGSWTQYPDDSGPCECSCHTYARAGMTRQCPGCGLIMSAREAGEQGACNDCVTRGGR